MNFKVKDHYFHKAKKENFLARSVFKLEEIDLKFKILKKHDWVLDLGYHPGSWIQYTSTKVGPEGFVIGIDIKEIQRGLENFKNVKLWHRDAFELTQLSDLGLTKPLDVVLSDMAPNTTGNKTVDQLGSLALVEKVFSLLPIFLKKGGHFAIKVFESNEAQVFLKSQLKVLFEEHHYFRPKSTRSTSTEIFVIGKKYKA
jgi:23S rRNA (uridine2552-2'-O)-methyltransferase